MAEIEAEISRAAAQKLIDLDPNLPALVEAHLQGGGESGGQAPKFDLATAIALAALIVQTADFVWKVFRELKGDKQPPASDVVRRRVRI
jgi:hypothetical protein